MGLFDLDEYQQKKARADESATPPRSFPVVFAEVNFDQCKQNLRFEPVLLDGGHVFISFRPQNADAGRTLIVGREWTSWREKDFVGGAQQGFVVSSEEAFEPETWLSEAVRNVESGYFGRLTVEQRRENMFFYLFYGAAGTVDEEDYAFYTDRTMWRYQVQQKADYDPSPVCDYWATVGEASELLIRLNADKFALHIERQKADPNSTYGLSLRWREVPVDEKYAMLPPCERAIESEVTALMRSIIWSDPTIVNGDVRSEKRTFKGTPLYSQTPLWRQPRFFVEPNTAKGETFNVATRLERRITTLWPHIASHFLPAFEHANRDSVHPCLLYWMKYRGAYIVELTEPTAHEHVEAWLHLRDFLAHLGISLDQIDTELAQHEQSEN